MPFIVKGTAFVVFIFPVITPDRHLSVIVAQQDGQDDAEDGSRQVIFEGNSRITRKDPPYHAAIEKEHDHRERNGNGITTQDADDKQVKHQSVGYPARAEVPGRPGDKPDDKATTDIENNQDYGR